MKNIAFVALGAFLAVIVLKIIGSRNKDYKSDVTPRFIDLAQTMQAMNLVKTNEFRELVKTVEFRELVKTLADEQINALTNTLM